MGTSVSIVLALRLIAVGQAEQPQLVLVTMCDPAVLGQIEHYLPALPLVALGDLSKDFQHYEARVLRF